MVAHAFFPEGLGAKLPFKLAVSPQTPFLFLAFLELLEMAHMTSGEAITMVPLQTPEPFEARRLLSRPQFKLLDQFLGILGPELYAISGAGNGRVKILRVHQRRADGREDIHSVIGPGLRRIDGLGIAMIPGLVPGKIDRLNPFAAIPADRRQTSVQLLDRPSLRIFELEFARRQAPLDAVCASLTTRMQKSLSRRLGYPPERDANTRNWC